MRQATTLPLQGSGKKKRCQAKHWETAEGRRKPACGSGRKSLVFILSLVFALQVNGISFSQDTEADKKRLDDLEQKVEVLSEEIEKLKLGEVEETYQSKYGFAPAASKVYYVKKGISLGGYGEMLYQGFKSTKDDGSRGARDEADFLRQIVYVGYKFSDKVVFNSEIEFEHASSGKKGEASVELSTLDFFLSDMFNARVGLLLVPMGLINEFHEPPTFHGAKRPDVESEIIPSTWRENGVGIFGENEKVSYRLYTVASLDSTGDVKNTTVRSWRASGSKSVADDLALTGRMDYKPKPDFLAGFSFFNGNTGQGKPITFNGTFQTIKARLTLWDIHTRFSGNTLNLQGLEGLEFRMLYARGKIGDSAQLNADKGLTGNKSIGSELFGWYMEGAYDISEYFLKDPVAYLAPFIRYERFNTQDSVPSGFSLDPANDKTTVTYGFTYKPEPNVVLKLDYQDRKNKKGTGNDQFNFAAGFLF